MTCFVWFYCALFCFFWFYFIRTVNCKQKKNTKHPNFALPQIYRLLHADVSMIPASEIDGSIMSFDIPDIYAENTLQPGFFYLCVFFRCFVTFLGFVIFFVVKREKIVLCVLKI